MDERDRFLVRRIRLNDRTVVEPPCPLEQLQNGFQASWTLRMIAGFVFEKEA
jgi:hypothetical protein